MVTRDYHLGGWECIALESFQPGRRRIFERFLGLHFKACTYTDGNCALHLSVSSDSLPSAYEFSLEAVSLNTAS